MRVGFPLRGDARRGPPPLVALGSRPTPGIIPDGWPNFAPPKREPWRFGCGFPEGNEKWVENFLFPPFFARRNVFGGNGLAAIGVSRKFGIWEILWRFGKYGARGEVGGRRLGRSGQWLGARDWGLGTGSGGRRSEGGPDRCAIRGPSGRGGSSQRPLAASAARIALLSGAPGLSFALGVPAGPWRGEPLDQRDQET